MAYVIGKNCSTCHYCFNTCPVKAIKFVGVEYAIDPDKCINCGACVRKCPRHIIGSRLQANSMVPLCSNEEKGVYASKKCSGACIGCHLCEKNCPADAIHVIDNHAVIDEEKCLACGRCVTVCPKHVIVDKLGVVLA